MLTFIIGLFIGATTGIGTMCLMVVSKDRQVERKFSNKISCKYADEYYCLDNIGCCKKPQFCEWAVGK